MKEAGGGCSEEVRGGERNSNNMDNGAYGNLGSPKSMASRRSATSYQSNDDHNSRLHKQLLAAEITKVRRTEKQRAPRGEKD